MKDIKNIKDDKLYTTDEVAEVLGVTPRTLSNYALAGKLKIAKKRKTIPNYYTGKSIKDFKKKQEYGNRDARGKRH